MAMIASTTFKPKYLVSNVSAMFEMQNQQKRIYFNSRALLYLPRYNLLVKEKTDAKINSMFYE